MKETTKNIMVAIAELGEEKVKAAGSFEALAELIRSAGVEVTEAELKEAMLETAQATGKQELSEESLEAVAGGAWWEYIIPGYNIYKIGKDIYDAVTSKPDPAPPTPSNSTTDANGSSNTTQNNNQNNSNNSGNQQVSQNGNNSMGGGMSQG